MAIANFADVDQRIIYLNGEISGEVAHRFITTLNIMDSVKGEILVVMNSVGGSCNDGFAIYDAIRIAKNPVSTIGFGIVASIAAIIFQAGDTRILSPECEFMIHDATVDIAAHDFSIAKAKALAKDIERIQERGNKILSTRSGNKLPKVEQWCKNETTFTAEEAVRYNFADGVIEYNDRGEE